MEDSQLTQAESRRERGPTIFTCHKPNQHGSSPDGEVLPVNSNRVLMEHDLGGLPSVGLQIGVYVTVFATTWRMGILSLLR